MTINRISIFDDFHCLMDKCPQNCCRGWNIPVDDEAVKKYNEAKGLDKVRFMHALKDDKGITVFESRHCKCPFWRRDRLCGIQKKLGIQYMPRVCVIYPRSLYNTGYFCEETLYLACPEAARLFVSNVRSGRHFYYDSIDETPDYKANTTNDDKDFLDYLLKTREDIVKAINGHIRYDSLALLRYALDAQNACTHNETLPEFKTYLERPEGNFVMTPDVFNGFLTNGFYHIRLKPRQPVLYKLCCLFFKEFTNIINNAQLSNNRLEKLKLTLNEKVPDINVILAGFYEYYILKSFLNIYEDYSFAKNLFLGMVKVYMIEILLALYVKDKADVSDSDIANVIAAFEKRSDTLETPYFNRLLSDILSVF